MADKGLYLYCVALPSTTLPTQKEDLGIKGIEGRDVFVFQTPTLLAVVQECEQSYGSDDMKTVSQWILSHQAVVDLAWEKFDMVVPFSFGTVIVAKEGKSARENLLDWLEKEQGNLKSKGEKLKGKAEYGIQITWDPMKVAPRIVKTDQEIQKLEKEIASKSSGTAYLLRQKLEVLVGKRMEQAADIYFNELYQKIKRCVEDIHVEKVRKEEPPRQMLMNLSCLLPKGEMDPLGEELDKIEKMEGFFVRFTGPWPPYSFV
ncbi:MAG: hypothetical protein A3G32_03875 [Deltaproteobacteria bacterium RIFCSPLOWO2_12_FULL_40_28]|nr:MAG: hypothetical protein A3C45_05765 [Deltaproteobacteria bacterium RIFCSPHIGHO2_02_FULL_40_28]OGQ19458.1 MAG: hypothetical protein A3E27_06395 [Deltaproteobacteria bacterium RIFCSPHIGHO2_12_FULL_40_32]OGQ39902.1 MAG: hypothetical protein A3I69_07360 [Deltaproteobacteria bacterium RIFCSPLOWO2_02_FULL_40_36]OGQ53895.1 MAG: hypothetical protein A3G32_03875 [Deltaproteobacteria bacterium RIFCSPLOWO2_12_FULL_40_28]